MIRNNKVIMPKSQNPFEKNSWYFRNSLVRANYTNMIKGIYMNTEYLEKFFRNLLLGESNELKNRYVHIRYKGEVAINFVESSDKVAIYGGSSDIILNYLKEYESINNAKARRLQEFQQLALEKHLKA